MNTHPHWPTALAWTIAGLCTSLAAQSASDDTSPRPSDPAQVEAAVPALAYRSALQTYRPWREQAFGDWRALNDEVTRIGGWRSYLREVNQAPAATGPSMPVTPALASPPASSAVGADASPQPAASTPADNSPSPSRDHHHGHR